MSNNKKSGGAKQQAAKQQAAKGPKKNPAAAARKKSNTASKKKNNGISATQKKVIAGVAVLVLALVICMAVFAGPSSKTNESAVTNESTQTTAQTSAQQQTGMPEPTKIYEGDELLSGKYLAEIDVRDYGVITVELDADIAPQTVSNFVKLASEGFYDGLTFHRVKTGFVIQGGSPTGSSNSAGSDTDTIRGEFVLNGIDNPISHVRGVISEARSGYYNSGSSQFFIVQQDSTYLDGQYAAFGMVQSGMDIVDKICENVPSQDENGTVLPEDQPIINSVRIIVE